MIASLGNQNLAALFLNAKKGGESFRLLRGGCLMYDLFPCDDRQSSSSSSSSRKEKDESFKNLTEAWNKDNRYEVMYRKTEGLDAERKVETGPLHHYANKMIKEELDHIVFPEFNKDPNLHKCYWRRNQTFYFWDEKYDESGNLGYVNIYIPVEITTWDLRVWIKKDKSTKREKEEEEEEEEEEERGQRTGGSGNRDVNDHKLDRFASDKLIISGKDITARALCVGVDSSVEVTFACFYYDVAGRFHQVVKTEDSLWAIEDLHSLRVLRVILKKLDTTWFWHFALEGEHELNADLPIVRKTKKVEFRKNCIMGTRNGVL
eukprot:jgi/Bigna1/78845/fgenesh1_pg.57_\